MGIQNKNIKSSKITKVKENSDNKSNLSNEKTNPLTFTYLPVWLKLEYLNPRNKSSEDISVES